MSTKNYLKKNNNYWSEPYNAENVESYIFRLKGGLLDKFISKKKIKVLDYGCGFGAQIKYLIEKHNYEGYGVDIAKYAINSCHKIMPKLKKNFKLIGSACNENDDFFNVKFDLIIANQSLYYLDDADLQLRLKSLKKMLKPGGHIFASMMSIKNSYFKMSVCKKKNSDFRELLHSDPEYKKRHKKKYNKCYINFIKDKKSLIKKFSLFQKILIGQYDLCYDVNLPGHHYTFFGKS